MKRHRLLLLVNLALFLLALALLWEAEVRAHWVWAGSIDGAVLERSRVEPAQPALQAVAKQRLGLPATYENKPAFDKDEAIRIAESLLKGTVEFHRKMPVPVRVPFERSNFDVGAMSHQLFIAGLVPVDLLLQAYRGSGDERFLRAAVDDIVAFERVDRYSLVPTGFQWNDHALANTMSILAETWSYIRGRKDIEASSAEALLRLAERTAKRLAKPGFFTYRTNHGIMQSVALLQFAAAFPALDSAKALGDTGCTRLIEQVRYYISSEGATLEHSAGYHEFGRQLIDIAVQLADLGTCRAPAEWRDKRIGTQAFSALLWRPDRSLPVFGNTDGTDRLSDDDVVPPKPGRAYSFLPVSGYAIWWSGLDTWPLMDRLSQTIVTWSNYPTRAHKHADDLSVLIWSAGVSWITTVGYWPYDAAGYADAQAWSSANAPHFVGEPPQDIPLTRILGSADGGRLRAIALERPAAGASALLRRQVVELDGTTWLIADSVSGQRSGKVERLWTGSASTEWADPAGPGFIFRAKGSSLAARMSFLGSLSGVPKRHLGESNPYLGWNVLSAKPTPAPAISVAQEGPVSLVVSVLQVDEEKRLRALAEPSLMAGATADAWSVVVTTRDGPVRVDWGPGHVSAGLPQGPIRAALQAAEPRWDSARDDIVSAYQEMGTRYTRFRELISYRYQLTGVFVALFLLQELAIWGLRRRAPAAVVPVRVLAACFWPAFGFYCAYVFLG